VSTDDFPLKLADPDAAYRLIAEAHRGLTEAESTALNARLVLILANECADLERLRAAVALAGRSAKGQTDRL
jgi:anthranilate phosphoribosyltransferase